MTISSIFQTNDLGAGLVSPTEEDGDTWTDDVNEVPVNAPRNVLNLKISNIYTAFRIMLVVNVEAAQNVSETFDLLGTYDGTNWSMTQNSVQNIGGSVNVNLYIDSTGQIKYSSTPMVTGFSKRIFKWVKKNI